MGCRHEKRSPSGDTDSLSLRGDLAKEPLIVSRLFLGSSQDGTDFSRLNISGTYSLASNASYMVEDGFGIALCFDGIINTGEQNYLCAVPVSDMELPVPPVLLWKKYQVMPQAGELFLMKIRNVIYQKGHV